MKKLLLLLLLASFTSNAQLRDADDFEIIPQIGYTSALIYNSNGDHSNTINPTNFGIAGDYYFNNRWSLRSGLLFQPMGGNTDKLNYLNIPLNANWHFGSTRKWNLNFGLTPGVLLTAKENGTDISNLVQNVQLGLSTGIGYKLELSDNFSLLLDYQYFYGLTNASNANGMTLKNACSNFNLGGVFLLD